MTRDLPEGSMERTPPMSDLLGRRRLMSREAGLWVSVVPFAGEHYVLLFLSHDDGSALALALEDHTPDVRAALRAVADEDAHRPPPRRYRVTAAHLRQHPALMRAVSAGRWTRAPWSPARGEPPD